MTAYADFDAFADHLGARRRQAQEAAPPLLLALEQSAERPPEPVRATAGLLASTLATALDDLGQAEEELRVQNEALFAAQTELAAEQRTFLDLFDLAPVAYAVTRADGQILRLNAPAFALLGRPANLATCKPLAVFVAPADRPAFRTALARPVVSGRVESWRMRLTPRHAEPVECRVFVRAVTPAPTGAGGDGACHSPAADAARLTSPTAPLLYWIITPELGDPADDLV